MPPPRKTIYSYALTISTFRRHRHFQRTASAELFLATLQRYRSQGKFLLHAYAVMPDHVHILLTPAADISTSRAVQLIKGGYSHAAHSDDEIWHTTCFEHRIRDLADFEAQRLYIAQNPARANLPNYPYVHTALPGSIDPTPSHRLAPVHSPVGRIDPPTDGFPTKAPQPPTTRAIPNH